MIAPSVLGLYTDEQILYLVGLLNYVLNANGAAIDLLSTEFKKAL